MSHNKVVVVESEKSPKVCSLNWREEVVLQKNVGILQKCKETIQNRISADQRIMNKRFQTKLSRSKLAYAKATNNRALTGEMRQQTTFVLNTNVGRHDNEDDSLRAVWSRGKDKYERRLQQDTLLFDQFRARSPRARRKAKSALARLRTAQPDDETPTSPGGFLGARAVHSARPRYAGRDHGKGSEDDDEEVEDKKVSYPRPHPPTQEKRPQTTVPTVRFADQVNAPQRPFTAAPATRLPTTRSTRHPGVTIPTDNNDDNANDVCESDEYDDSGDELLLRPRRHSDAHARSVTGEGSDRPHTSFFETDRFGASAQSTQRTPRAATVTTTPTARASAQSKPSPQGGVGIGSMFGSNERRVTLLDLQKLQNKLADYDGKVAAFVATVKGVGSVGPHDYYTSRMGSQGRREGRDVTGDRLDELEYKRMMKHIGTRSLTMKALDWNFDDRPTAFSPLMFVY